MSKPYFAYGTNFNNSNRDLVTSTVRYENQTKRYFSSLDAEIYMGGVRILDIYRIDFSYQENKMPIYGFNSFMPSKVIVGQKLIQGTFVINFTKPGYIAELLSGTMKESSIANEYDKVGSSCDPNNSALFKKPFDILLGYGGYKTENEVSYKSCCQMLQGVYITGFQQILDASGEPVYETYSFIARNFTFDGVDKIYQGGATNSTITDVVTPQPSTPQQETVPNNNTNKEPDKEEATDNSAALETQLFKSKVLFDKTSAASSNIHVSFPNELRSNINVVKVVISDNTINMSRSYTLRNVGTEWTITLNASDTNLLCKRLPKINSTMNCHLEVKYKNNKNALHTRTKAVKLYRAK